MRPLQLNIQAFGPFAEREELDFGLLDARALFLIHGPTGGGKTTILDAMCYALFGETSGNERDGKHLRSHFSREDLATLVSFDFQHGDTRYRVERLPEQEVPKKRGEGTTMQKAEGHLFRVKADGSTEVIASKLRDCTARVEALLGLKVDQFRQVIMIPQGQFRKLLLAEVAEREAILNTLFRTHHFEAIQLRLKENAASLERERRELVQRRDIIFEQCGVEDEDGLKSRLAEMESEEKEVVAKQKELAARVAAQATALDTVKSLVETARGVLKSRESIARIQSSLEKQGKALEGARKEWKAEDAKSEVRINLQKEIGRLEGLEKRVAGYDAARKRRDTETARAKTLSEQITKTTARIGKGEAKAEELRKEEKGLRDLAARVDERRKRHDQWKKRQELDTGLVVARKEVTLKSGARAKAKKELETCEHDVSQMEDRFLKSRAAALAAELTEEEPCPVCGSTDHPRPATSDESIPDEKDLKSLRERVSKLRRHLEKQIEEEQGSIRKEGELEARLKDLESALTGEIGEKKESQAAAGLESAATALKESEKAVAALDANEKMRAKVLSGLKQLAEEVEEGKRQMDQSHKTQAAAAAEVLELEKTLEEPLRKAGALASQLKKERVALASAEKRLKSLRDTLESFEKEQVDLQARREETDKARKELEADFASQHEKSNKDLKIPQDVSKDNTEELSLKLEALANTGRDLAKVQAELQEALGQCRARIRQWRDHGKKLKEISRDLSKLDDRYRVVGTISRVANGENPSRLTFQNFVLGALLDDVVITATRRLRKMSHGRYELHRQKGVMDKRRRAGLELMVFDHNTGRERPVATLSGGESFLASLALALGLAEVTEAYAGGVRMETIFIDEGFGTLDSDALDLAFNTLHELQEGGRLVGVISHVSELKERIDARLEVTTTPHGSTAKFVV